MENTATPILDENPEHREAVTQVVADFVHDEQPSEATPVEDYGQATPEEDVLSNEQLPKDNKTIIEETLTAVINRAGLKQNRIYLLNYSPGFIVIILIKSGLSLKERILTRPQKKLLYSIKAFSHALPGKLERQRNKCCI